jgi:hypothetical protein
MILIVIDGVDRLHFVCLIAWPFSVIRVDIEKREVATGHPALRASTLSRVRAGPEFGTESGGATCREIHLRRFGDKLMKMHLHFRMHRQPSSCGCVD